MRSHRALNFGVEIVTQLDAEEIQAGLAYGRLVELAIAKAHTSYRLLEKSTGISRKRIAQIVKGGDATHREERAINRALDINPVKVAIAMNHGDPEEYFTAELELVACFAIHMASQVLEQSQASEATFEPIRPHLIAPLAHDLTKRVIRHQEARSLRQAEFMG